MLCQCLKTLNESTMEPIFFVDKLVHNPTHDTVGGGNAAPTSGEGEFLKEKATDRELLVLAVQDWVRDME